MSLIQFARFFLYLAAFSITIVLTATFFPFIGGKYYFFRLMVELALMFGVLSWALEDNDHVVKKLKSVSKEPIFIAVSIFAICFLAASIFAYDPNAAFWSNFERGEGGFQMIHYYLFFALMMVFFDSPSHWFTMVRSMLAAGVLMILYGLAAAAQIGNFVGPYYGSKEGLLGNIFAPGQRFQGSLGNPAYVAPYLMFSMFYAAWLWVAKKGKELKDHLIYGGLIIFFSLFFVLSQTRGAFIGLVAGLAFFLLYLIFFGGGSKTLRKYTLIAGGIFLATGIGLYSIRTSPVLNEIPGGRLINFDLSADSFKTRMWTWESAWEGFKERPILGWGPENFSIVFDRHFNKNHFVPGQNTETWFDRGHSIIFDYLSTTGTLGFLSYVAIFLTIYFQFWKKIIRKKSNEENTKTSSARHESFTSLKESQILKALFVSMPVAYLVQGLVLFDVLPIYINIFFFFALAGAILNHNHEQGI